METRIGWLLEVGRALLGFYSTNMSFKSPELPNLDTLELDEGMPLVNWQGCLAGFHCMKSGGGDLLEAIDLWCYEEAERVPGLQLEVDRCLDCSSSGKIVGGCLNGKLFMFGVSEMGRRKGCSFQLFAYHESLAYVKEMVPAAVSKREEKVEFNDIDGFFVSTSRRRDGQIACYFALALTLLLGL